MYKLIEVILLFFEWHVQIISLPYIEKLIVILLTTRLDLCVCWKFIFQFFEFFKKNSSMLTVYWWGDLATVSKTMKFLTYKIIPNSFRTPRALPCKVAGNNLLIFCCFCFFTEILQTALVSLHCLPTMNAMFFNRDLLSGTPLPPHAFTLSPQSPHSHQLTLNSISMIS